MKVASSIVIKRNHKIVVPYYLSSRVLKQPLMHFYQDISNPLSYTTPSYVILSYANLMLAWLQSNPTPSEVRALNFNLIESEFDDAILNIDRE